MRGWNPFKEMLHGKLFTTRRSFGETTGLRMQEILDLEDGKLPTIPSKAKEGLSKLGINYDRLKTDYEKWYQENRKGFPRIPVGGI